MFFYNTIFFLIFIFNIQNGLTQDPTVTIKQTVPETSGFKIIIAHRDLDTVMDCYVDNLYGDLKVRWQREYLDVKTNLKKTQLISQNMALEDNIKYSIEKPTEYTWSLRIRGTQVGDEGKYVCFVQLTQIGITSDYRIVQVVVFPYFDSQSLSSDLTASEGESEILNCNATGRPSPTITWTRFGGQLLSIGQEIFEGSKLPLNNMQASDRGVYRCTALNSVGSTIHNVRVNVIFKPIIQVINNVVKQAVGYRVELQCFIEANPFPNPTSSAWMKGTATFSVSSDRYIVNWIEGAFNQLTYELIITNVQPEDFGKFSCRVSNDKDASKGVVTASITLEQSPFPLPSIKLGRIVSASENQGAASIPPKGHILLTILALLISALIFGL